jgi:hypothetical protein
MAIPITIPRQLSADRIGLQRNPINAVITIRLKEWIAALIQC